MKYGIYPLGDVQDVYSWRHATLGSAKEHARALSIKHKSDFIVFEIVGTFRNQTVWEDIEGKDNG